MKKYFVLLVAVLLTAVACSEEPEVEMDKQFVDMDYKGGEFDFTLSANYEWELIINSDNEDLLDVSQVSGPEGTQVIHVAVSENESTSILKHYFTAVAHGTKRDAVTYFCLTQGAPAYVQFSKNTFTANYIGGEFEFTVSSNFPWAISVVGEGITVEPMSGAPTVSEEDDTTVTTDKDGDKKNSNSTKITVTIDEYEGDVNREFILNVKARGEDAVVSDQLTIKQTSPTLVIGNREYRIKKMRDGRWWMLDNLCYSQKGITIGDGLCGVWYPCSSTAAEPDNSVEGIVSKGLLYSDAVAFNTNITATTAKRQEGAQGLCPEGWHIPTLNEFMSLVGKSTNSQLEVKEDAPYYDASKKAGSLLLLEADGFCDSTNQAGYIMGRGKGYENGFSTEGYLASRGYVTTTYIYSSSYYSSGATVTQWYCLQLNRVNNTANVGYMNNYTAQRPNAGSVRCIKDR